ncbi:Beta-carbonic anhydrase 1 [Candidatus Calditenuaceae archaeon HR02]|nr:Beta-carbonic anhydrase 1 [Candidatus Calditenuaceae archaeon HR02]
MPLNIIILSYYCNRLIHKYPSTPVNSMHAERLEAQIKQLEDYALRRVRGIPNNRSLFVLTCMDERIRIESALGLEPDDAHIFRNAGGVVTDDVIRSAALTTNFFGTREIIVVNHTDCGMLRFKGAEVADYFLRRGIKPAELAIDPLLPALGLKGEKEFANWFKFFTDLGVEYIDDIVIKNVEALRNSPLIPRDVAITGYVYEVETHRLRKPHQRIWEATSKFEKGKVVER